MQGQRNRGSFFVFPEGCWHTDGDLFSDNSRGMSHLFLHTAGVNCPITGVYVTDKSRKKNLKL